MDKKLLIIGADHMSLGHRIKTFAKKDGWEVHTAGIRNEDWFYDARSTNPMNLLLNVQPRSIVNTCGINNFQDTWYDHLMINCVSHVEMLKAWEEMLSESYMPERFWFNQYVSISSNSARIPRAGSGAYCASKAALSMAIQCEARRMSKVSFPLAAYVYEPGYLDGTPMSLAYEDEHKSGTPFHRIPAGLPMDPDTIARVIVHNLAQDGRMFTGTCLRLDGGEI